MKYEVFEVDLIFEGCTSPIDVIQADEHYTAEQYIEDCADNADDEWNEMLSAGTVKLIKLTGREC